MVARDHLRPEALLEVNGDTLRELPRRDEDECRSMLLDQGDDTSVDLIPDFSRAHGFERRSGELDREVELSHVAFVDDLARAIGTREESRDRLDRPLRRREADPLQMC